MSEATAKRKPSPPAQLLESYRALDGVFDEVLDADGQPRAHYAAVLGELETLGVAELKRRWDTAGRYVHEQGITYNIYGDARGMERPWLLDPLPFVISAADWRTLETALIQRATLIDHILADCYGPQELLRTGRLPPALIFAQADFLRPCHGVKVAHDRHLHLYAADLARSPDGRWWVTSDRTQIPTGSGYALANRLVTSRILPEPFRDCHVHRLAGFFREMQASLAQLASRRTDNPRVVLLTPGPFNETYFEQAYLARYLGYTLVEGQDLTVRDDRVFLKTLSGLEPVDVILRRVDDEFCDPLELRNDSMLGVPGLVEALRAGNVAVANPPGSSLLQSPAFMAFLPGLCRHLLGEELKLPSVATWWCGQKNAAAYVREHLEKLFVKPAFRPRTGGMKAGEPMKPEELEALQRRLAFQPHLFVGQERVKLATAPVWDGAAGLVARPVGLRVYLVATADGYRVMPGGLTRVAPDEDGRFLSMQKGGGSKDTWVLSEGPVPDETLLQTPEHRIQLHRVGNNLPSRLADNFSGSAVTPSAPTPRRGCCAARCCASIPSAPAARFPCSNRSCARWNCRARLRSTRGVWNCAATPRRSRPNCSPPFSIHRARPACTATPSSCSASRCSCATALPTIFGACSAACTISSAARPPASSCSRATPPRC